MQINIIDLTFGYNETGVNLFENLNLSFDTKFKIGFVGRNGRGKTTFLKLLQGKLDYKGKIVSPVTFDYFPFEIKNKNKLAIEILDEVYSNYELWKVLIKMKQLNLSEDILYQNYNTLSNGEQTKLLLSVLFTKENNFLLLDEPTNHLDIEARESVKNFLNNEEGFIVVSHDRSFLDGCVDHIISINKNDVVLQKGNFTSFLKNKEDEDNFALNKNKRLKNEISRLEDSIKIQKKWADVVEKSKIGTYVAGLRIEKGHAGRMAAKMMQRAQNCVNRKNKMIDEKKSLLKNVEINEELFINSNTLNTNSILVDFQNVNIYYEEKQITNNVTFTINEGDKIAIVGKNGSGKTSIIKLLLGENIKYDGRIYKNGRLKISYISQNFDHIKGTLIEFCKNKNLNSKKFFVLLSKLGFTETEFHLNIESFSAGQKKKVLIAESLSSEANFYIFDEPLNYIDIISRIQIENLIKNSNITLLFVEHDKTFINNVATKIINL